MVDSPMGKSTISLKHIQGMLQTFERRVSSQEIRENTVSTHLHWLKCLVFFSSIGATNNKANPCEFPKGKLPS